MYPIKQSTAETVPFFVHDSNGDAVTGLTDGTFTKRISKGSAAFGAMTVTISELENGWYSIPLSTDHSDTTGLLTVVFTNAGAKQVNLQWRVDARLPDDLFHLASVYEGTVDVQGFLRLAAAVLLQISGGGGTTTLTFQDEADAKARITATVDANGNRTAVVTDVTD